MKEEKREGEELLADEEVQGDAKENTITRSRR